MFSRALIATLLALIALANAQPGNGMNMGMGQMKGNGMNVGMGQMKGNGNGQMMGNGNGQMMGNGNGQMMGNGNGNNGKVTCQTFKNQMGAHGLCNAYCKAKKCQDKSPPTMSCSNLKNKFLLKTGESKMPCDPEIVVTDAPTGAPTAAPTGSATEVTTGAPTAAPSTAPTAAPIAA